MMEFCAKLDDPVAQDTCNFLAQQYALEAENFDIGLQRLDLSTGKPVITKPESDGVVSEPEVFQQAIVYAEKEYRALAASIKKGEQGIPTPFLNFLSATGNDIPWLIKDRKTLAGVLAKLDTLQAMYPKGGAALFKGLYAMISSESPKGFGIEFPNVLLMEELDIDGVLARKEMRCSEFAILFLGLSLLLDAPLPDVLQRVGDSNVGHVFIGISDGGKYYHLDPATALSPLPAESPKFSKPSAVITKPELLGIYFAEKGANCVGGGKENEKLKGCLATNKDWGLRYAPHSHVALYNAAVADYYLGDYAGAQAFVSKTLSAYPLFSPALTTMALLNREPQRNPK